MSADTHNQSNQGRRRAFTGPRSPQTMFSRALACSPESRMIASAVAALLVGSAVYIVDRDWSTVLFLAPFTGHAPLAAGLFGSLGGSLPALLHAFAIPVFMLAALSAWPRSRPWVCLAWFGIAAGLEILQSDAAAAWLSAAVGLPGKSSFFEYIEAYARQGRFDAVDLIATGVGCSIAFTVSLSSAPQGRRRSA